ncbi:MAG: N-acetylglucosamine-6-phosphate deacetylase [Pararhodobacter sp.]
MTEDQHHDEPAEGTLWQADWLHDGSALTVGAALWVQQGRVRAVLPPGARLPSGAARQVLGRGGIVPGFVDLQVNGGDGVMLGAGTDAATIARLCACHARLGATAIMPTLITDRPEVTGGVIAAAIAAHRAGVPGYLGLHLEGPHLDRRRAGAHDPALIRPMGADDLALYCQAAAALPAFMVTLAPEGATPDQIAALTRAGAIVALGHSDCTAEAVYAAQDAGARVVTHLFNAMSPFSHRAPGLTGAALDADGLACGLIADGWHAAPQALRLAMRAKPRDALFLVSDAMALAGSEQDSFELGGRSIRRAPGEPGLPGRLTLADGTLAGADLTLPQAVAHLVGCGAPPERAIAMASRIPAQVIGADAGRLYPGARADFLHLDDAMHLCGVWQAGHAVR